jgi:hypothetical protein
MMMTSKKCIIVFFLIVLPYAGFSQNKDFGIWYGISAEHKLAKKLELDLSANIRTFNNASKIEEAFLEGGLTYNLKKHLSVAGSYRISKNIENNNSLYYQHKMFLDLKGGLPLGKLNFSGRLRFQVRTKTYITSENDKFPDYIGRIKFKSIYKTQTFPVDPYIYAETFCPMFSDKSGTIGKNRFAAGIEINILKKHSVDLEYIFQRDYQPHLSDLNILSVNYDIKF